MDTIITLTISLCDAREANDRINDNRWLANQLQQTATNQWESAESYDTDDDEEGRPHITTITLKEWQAGIDKLGKESKRSLAHLIAEIDDYYDANNAIQVVMFGEEIYG